MNKKNPKLIFVIMIFTGMITLGWNIEATLLRLLGVVISSIGIILLWNHNKDI